MISRRMTWKPKQTNQRSRWRNYLTDEELEVIKAIDAAKANWLKLNKQRAEIVNRAVKRSRDARGAK